jgi:hypothetical protein
MDSVSESDSVPEQVLTVTKGNLKHIRRGLRRGWATQTMLAKAVTAQVFLLWELFSGVAHMSEVAMENGWQTLKP